MVKMSLTKDRIVSALRPITMSPLDTAVSIYRLSNQAIV